MIDYKIVYMKRWDDKTEVVIRYYDGAITTEKEYDIQKQELADVTRYRRTKMLDARKISYSGNIAATRDDRDVNLKIFLNEKLDAEADRLKTTTIDEQMNTQDQIDKLASESRISSVTDVKTTEVDAP